MAALRYGCNCTRYLSPTRFGSGHSAPTSPARWRSSTTKSSSTTRVPTVAASDSEQQQVVASPEEVLQARQAKRQSHFQSRLFNLKLSSLADNLKDVREWTAMNAPKMDARSVAKLMSSLNIDLPRYQRLVSNRKRVLTSGHSAEIERLKREQLEEKRSRLLKKLDETSTAREEHDFGKAMSDTHESIQTYYSSIIFPSSTEKAKTDTSLAVTAPQLEEGETRKAVDLNKVDDYVPVISPSLQKEDVPQKVLEIQTKEKVARASVDKRTRGLVCGLKMATTDASRLNRLEDLCAHLTQYTKFAKNVAIKEKVIPCLLKLRNSKDMAISQHACQALRLVGHVDPVKGRGIRILAIDGGGTRGLIALEMMRQLEVSTGRPIHDMFDYICGVSTGALIAVMVGVFRQSIDECERLYKEFSQEMFGRNRLLGASKLVTTHAFYDSQLWEKILQENIGLGTFIDTMKDEKCPKISIVSSLVNQTTMENYLFRNYTHTTGVQSKYRGSLQHHLWEAIRASSAAPGYYEELKLGEHIHQDGGLLTNNPAAIAIHECKLLWPNESLQCVISVGTGRFRSTNEPAPSYSLKDKLLKVVQSATDTEAVHTILHDLLPPSTYFRFNPYMSDDFLLDEISVERWELMKQDALMYCRKNEMKLATASKQLLQAKQAHQKAAEWVQKRRESFS